MATIPTLSTPAAQPLHPQMQEIRRVAQEFEAMVLAELLQPVFEQLDTDGLGGGGDGEQMFRPMLVQQYAQRMAETGGIGLADSVMRDLMRLQLGEMSPEEAAAQASAHPIPIVQPQPIPVENDDGADR